MVVYWESSGHQQQKLLRKEKKRKSKLAIRKQQQQRGPFWPFFVKRPRSLSLFYQSRHLTLRLPEDQLSCSEEMYCLFFAALFLLLFCLYQAFAAILSKITPFYSFQYNVRSWLTIKDNQCHCHKKCLVQTQLIDFRPISDK